MGNRKSRDRSVSRVLDEIYIEFNGGKPEFTLYKSQNNCGDAIARVDFLDQVLSDECMHYLCDTQMRAFLGEWDGQWSSVPQGTYIISPEIEGLEFDQKIFEGHYLVPYAGSVEVFESTSVSRTLASFPRMWELFGFLLPRTTRERVFEPAYNDLLAQYLKALDPKFDTPAALTWLNFCFTARSILLVVDCFKGIVTRSLLLGLMSLVPTGVKEWCITLFWSLFKQ